MSRYLDKSQKVMTNLDNLKNLDSLDEILNTTKSRLKSLDFKNLNQEIKKFGLNPMDNLEGFQKLVSTD
jgi:hypothetical protein